MRIIEGIIFIPAGGDAAASPATGAYGAIIKSKAYRGMYVQAQSPGYFTAVFDGPLGIYIQGGGSCTGCTAAYVALNNSDQEIAPGAFLTVEGVQVDPDLNVPVMLVRPVSSSSDPVIGVSGSATSE